jgi:hypothetical protein
MLKVGALTESQSSSIFTGSDSISLTPVVSAEWNHNLFNPPYITVAGSGASIIPTLKSGGSTVSNVTSGGKPNFTTRSFPMSDGTGTVSYDITSVSSPAYKIITYLKTSQPVPVMVTLSGKGASTQFGSEQVEADSLGWTKVITYVGSSGPTDIISSFVYTITANALSNADYDEDPIVYFTLPQIYATTYFDYQNHSLFPTEMPFTYFRPGESYVSSGDSKYIFPSNYRRIASQVLNNETTSGGFYGDKYMPISPIIQNPKFFLVRSDIPVMKSALPTDVSPYRYFVSDDASKTIAAIYEKAITTNKIVLKFNTLMTLPTINVKIFDGINWTAITVDTSQSITTDPDPLDPDPIVTGIITLYWNGSAWTKTKWSTMPQFTTTGSLSLSTLIKGISVTQVSQDINIEIAQLNGVEDPETDIGSDLERMHLVELSPRLEVDLTDFVQSVSINKSLDANSSALPISSLNTNDANIVLSGIPVMSGSTIVPIFSSQSDQSSTILANMLRKNIKFYVNFNLATYSTPGSTTASNKYIPGGVFYSDSWDETDIQTVTVQAFDVSRYLQSTPVPDYVANLKSVFDIITNILDLAGFTDYDYDSLYRVCNSKSSPLDISYYYVNSKDSTILDALNNIFVAYQIGAYIDEYGIMKFLSLHNILSSTASNLSLSEANIVQNGFSVSNAAKPGKISLRYQTPKVKQSPSLQNVTNADIKDSPSFVYTTSNDVVWSQQTNDSVGFNYLKDTMEATSNVMKINNNDLLDIFHTYNLNNDGYAFIENEIVSFTYKEYTISTIDESNSVTVSVKNNLELSAEIDRFIKEYSIGLLSSYATITNASGDETSMTYTANNNFTAGQKISITGVDPQGYNIIGIVGAADSTTFVVGGTGTGTYVSGGEAVISSDYDIKITPTGNITNVQRGLFGTYPSKHERINTLSTKDLSKNLCNVFTNEISPAGAISYIVDDSDPSGYGLQDPSLPSIDKIRISDDGDEMVLMFPTSEVDLGYHTYSVKFELTNQDTSAAGIFFNMESDTEAGDAYFVQLVKLNTKNPKTDEPYSPARYKYIMQVYDAVNDGILYWSDVTGECNSIISNFSKIIKKTQVEGKTEYSFVTDNAFNLRVAHVLSDGSEGEDGTEDEPLNILHVFLNNVQITGWQRPQSDNYDEETNPGGGAWAPMDINYYTGTYRKPSLPDNILSDTKFGFCTTRVPREIDGVYPPIDYFSDTVDAPAMLREIHATVKPLLERSVSYFYQDREFLNGIVQNQPLYNNSPTYIMQTTPEIAGINYYDVQYTNPAAVSVDVLPIEYMMKYYPGNSPEDQTKYQKKLVDEYSLSYSTPLNTGFRARMAVANGRPHAVILKKDSDELNDLTNNFNLWTHEIVAPSDPEIIEQVVDPSNMSEVVQLDSEWIQSKQAAYKMLKVIQMGIEGFSKTVSLNIFGHPLIQVGDIVTLSYNLNGISGQKYFVQSVAQSFSQGLETSLVLKRIQE